MLLGVSPPVREGLIQTGVVVAVLLLTALVISRLGHRVTDRLVARAAAEGGVHGAERSQRIRTLWVVGRAFVLIVLAVALILLLLDVWGVPIGPFLAVGSVLGVALGLGAQGLVRDVIAGFFIIAEDQYGIDDVVRIGGVEGKVESIRLRTTVLRDVDGSVHHVPNGQVTVASNLTQEFSQVVVDVPVSPQTDVDEASAILTDVVDGFAADPQWAAVFLDPPEVLGVERFEESATVIRVVFRVAPAFRLTARREFLRRLRKRFDAEGVSLP